MQLGPPEDRTPLRVRVKLIGADRRDFEDYVKDLGARYVDRTLVFHVQNEWGITVERKP